ncbi:putative disease resistance RPP13-like protein 1 [Corylus avellana]|uniref:putative disease resistance RPP13-like protein 1 n=1 Tax=Corylus avellana TaxID=13451 RepID=UPI00286B73C8|nr:putative disease resistance RPP13-like protein 1 [Corylus avellana]
MAVGEIFLAAFLQVLFEKLMSPELLKFARRYKGLREKMEKLEKTLSRIEDVLDDADQKQHTERAVKRWLDDLRDLAYDAEDILDEFATEALLHELKGENQASTSKVRNLIPTCCTGLTPHALKINIRLQSKFTEITNRFNDLVIQKDELRLLKATADGRSYRKAGTMASTSVVPEPHVYGRDSDKEALFELLLSEKCRNAQLSVIPILGMGGIGKTTLAQDLFNDKKVEGLFDLKSWACVSEDFDAERVTKTILQSLTSENCNGKDQNWLLVKLKEKLEGKKFLVVLDDLWNEKYHDWTILRAPFLTGALGSTIVITTRNEGVSSMTGTVPAYPLPVLSNNACLSLFTQHALGASDFSAHPNLQDIGEEMVKRCKGLPLAAKTLGGLLRTKRDRDGWKGVLESKIWNILEEKNEFVPALMLSYHHLPSHLKRCFAYCSILPKDYEFEKQQLVLLWMGEGLIQQQEGDEQMEDLGSRYFCDLLSRSFFQQSSTEKSRFVMHDLINDLAQWVAKDICFRMEDRIEGINKGQISKKVRHLSYLGDYFDGPKRFEVFSELTCLRTFMPLMLPRMGGRYLTHDVPLKLLSKLLRLRVLSLSGYCIVELPNSIGDLKHLRYLDLSYTNIRGLPESTTTLRNLHTLILEECHYLKELPLKLGNLVSLRHLNILNANRLEGLPPQIGKLTCLQTLSNVIVGKGNCFTLKELGSLLHLRGPLIISQLENVVESRDAKSIEKLDLSALCLEWSRNIDESKDRTSELEILNMLHPNKSLKELAIKCYGGIEFSTWLKGNSFPNMLLLRIENCRKCTSLPAVSQLPLLKHLFIKGMAAVKNVGHEFNGEGCSQAFRSLETLHFEDMEEWENWSPNGEFPHLRELSIKNCPKLLGTLPNHLPSLQNIVIERCEQLVVPISSFPELCKLEIEELEGVVRNGKVDFTSLDSKSLSTILKFRCPIEGFMNVEDLTIDNCEERMPFWSNDVGLLQPLPRLRNLWVVGCQKLVSLVAEEVKEQPQQGMPSTRSPIESLPKAVVYNSMFLERIEIYGCDSLTHIAIGQLPPTLKRLVIRYCNNMVILVDEDDTNSSSSITSLLEFLLIDTCPSLKSLKTSSEEFPATLKDLRIGNCEMLESVAKTFHHSSSLEEIYIWDCENLKSLLMGIHSLSHLQHIQIWRCSTLVSFPDGGLLPRNLRKLWIRDCKNMQALPNSTHNITSLQELCIENCPGIVSFPDEGFSPNLTSLKVKDCNITEALLEWGLHRLTSLQHLEISGGCPHLESFQEMMLPASLTTLIIINFPNLKYLSSKGLRYLSSLQTLRIGRCEKLMSFPDDGLPPSLLELRIFFCEKFTSFPEDGLPPTLQQLHIENCPLLKERCKKDQGRDWNRIAHIPCVSIDCKFIYDPEDENQTLGEMDPCFFYFDS